MPEDGKEPGTQKTEDTPDQRLVTRRSFLKGMVATMGAAAVSATGLGMALSAFGPEDEESGGDPSFQYYVGYEESGLWYGSRHLQTMQAADFPISEGANGIWPAMRDGFPVIVIRFPREDALVEVNGSAVFEDSVFLAFGGRCPHACCIPGWHKSLPPRRLVPGIDASDYPLIHCACHDSQFDPRIIVEDRDGSGNRYIGADARDGPANRALPLVPITIEDGVIKGWPHHPDWYSYC